MTMINQSMEFTPMRLQVYANQRKSALDRLRNNSPAVRVKARDELAY